MASQERIELPTLRLTSGRSPSLKLPSPRLAALLPTSSDFHNSDVLFFSVLNVRST